MFNRTKSVATITAGLTKMVTDLEAHAVAQEAQRAAALAEVARLLAEAEEHHLEAEKATKVAANISALVA